jgi:hypothetical protein
MKVGVLQFFGWLDRSVPLASIYEMALERIAIMDSAGYDAVWLAEHHFSGFSVCPSVHMMGVMVAAKTRRLRIGTGVSLAPFYNPLRLAEEVALLDVLSGGRVNWRAGRGFERSESKAFGLARSTRRVYSSSRLGRTRSSHTRGGTTATTASRYSPSRCKPRTRPYGWRRVPSRRLNGRRPKAFRF